MNLDSKQVAKSILFTSTEPCAMCSGAVSKRRGEEKGVEEKRREERRREEK